ncbi:hypothetical protein B0H14DRAFT_3147031 [Mycena olivaceomarginata]|nr:hypothetical protein B0H14DRAFT_3147031 [Mycena olivaceomarginata]
MSECLAVMTANFESEMMVVWSGETGLYCRQHELNSYKQQKGLVGPLRGLPFPYLFHSYYCTVFTFAYFFAAAAFVSGWEPSVNVSTRAKFLRRVMLDAVNAEGWLGEVPAGRSTPKSGG